MMQTITDKIDPDQIDSVKLKRYADIVKKGGLVAFPTETVYGLGANALDDAAVRRIFNVKNRPVNNPLIAHICDIDMLPTVAHDVPPEMYELFSSFWPGALTVVLAKTDSVPDSVTAGGDTVAVRCPSHPVANELIRLSGVPIVAPSANLSGKPSPTCFEHVYSDLNTHIDGIIDGGACEIGIESTVVVLTGKRALKILRPGVITAAMLEQKGFGVEVDKNVLAPVKDNTPVSSPGMLYRHYAPRAQMELVRGPRDLAVDYICSEIKKNDCKVGVLCFDGESGIFSGAKTIEYGTPLEPLTLSQNLFSALRRFDKTEVAKIYARVIEPEGIGLGIYNRMLRAASFNVKSL